MKTAIFGAKPYEVRSFEEANGQFGHELLFLPPNLSAETAALADGSAAACAFVNDCLDRAVLNRLARGGTRLIVLRCAGFNHVDLIAAKELGLSVARVPSYSPHAIAEHTLGMILCLNRKIHRAYNRVREGNFALEGLLGFDLHGKTVGVVGTGNIGALVARSLLGLGCRVVAHDQVQNPDCVAMGVDYVSMDRLLAESDVITLHCPLTPQTRHLINAESLGKVKPGVMLINTSRGPVLDTKAAIQALKDGRLGYLGLDVYEGEAGIFFENQAEDAIRDDLLARLLTFPNVLVTGHQAFFTKEALANIAETTLANVSAFERGEPNPNAVNPE